MTHYNLSNSGVSFPVEVTRLQNDFKVVVNGRTILLRLQPAEQPGSVIAQIGDRPLKIEIEGVDDQRVVLVIEGERLAFHRTANLSAIGSEQMRPQAKHQNDSLNAPMPGRVISVLAREGKRVSEGDPMVIIESMKMETVIRSDRSAEVEDVLVSEGSAIRRGQPLVRYRP